VCAVLRLTTAPSFPNQTPSTLHRLSNMPMPKQGAFTSPSSPPSVGPCLLSASQCGGAMLQRACCAASRGIRFLLAPLPLPLKLTHRTPTSRRQPPREGLHPGQEGRGMWTCLASIPAIHPLARAAPPGVRRGMLSDFFLSVCRHSHQLLHPQHPQHRSKSGQDTTRWRQGKDCPRHRQ
jgi:hypothetical protein